LLSGLVDCYFSWIVVVVCSWGYYGDCFVLVSLLMGGLLHLFQDLTLRTLCCPLRYFKQMSCFIQFLLVMIIFVGLQWYMG
jgi:hypothetical protein